MTAKPRPVRRNIIPIPPWEGQETTEWEIEYPNHLSFLLRIGRDKRHFELEMYDLRCDLPSYEGMVYESFDNHESIEAAANAVILAAEEVAALNGLLPARPNDPPSFKRS